MYLQDIHHLNLINDLQVSIQDLLELIGFEERDLEILSLSINPIQYHCRYLMECNFFISTRIKCFHIVHISNRNVYLTPLIFSQVVRSLFETLKRSKRSKRIVWYSITRPAWSLYQITLTLKRKKQRTRWHSHSKMSHNMEISDGSTCRVCMEYDEISIHVICIYRNQPSGL